jgi:hypothetical protein
MNGRRLRARAVDDSVSDSAVGRGRLLAAPQVRTKATHSPHSPKFRLAIAVLIGAAIASVAAAVVLGSNSKSKSQAAPFWSSFQPTDGGLTGAQEIADYVSPLYRASSAYQLAVVTTVNLNDPSNPLAVVIPSGSNGQLQVLSPSSTIAYNLCGINTSNCTIGVGAPSSARLLLLRREALELALYTFKYISSAQTVVAILPPGHTTSGCTGICPKPNTTTTTKPVDLALGFDRADLQPLLDRPIDETLPSPPPSVSAMPNAPDAELVSLITGHGLFSEQVEQAQDGSNLIVLNPQPPQ